MLISLLALFTLAPLALAQNETFLAGFVATLQSAGLTQLISIAGTLNGTANGQALLANISNGSPHLLFAPNDAAWAMAPSNETSDNNTLLDTFSYHIVPGNFSNVDTMYQNVTLGQTLYSDPATVHLEGNRPQVVAWTVRSDGKTHVLNQRNDSTVVNTTAFGNITIYIVDHVLHVPENLAAAATANDALPAFDTVLSSASLAFYNSSTNQTSDVTFFDAFDSGYRGFTLFAPNTAAVNASNSTLQSLVSNRTAINNILYNHLINGTTVYSPLLAGSEKYTSAAGQTLSFSINATGQYVTLGNITATIVQPDILLPNGVIHIIDQVLLDTDNDPSAASSA
ncbi:hypothetical protein PHLCEN_2v10036, partial [Hermanssonia centrifuga]